MTKKRTSHQTEEIYLHWQRRKDCIDLRISRPGGLILSYKEDIDSIKDSLLIH
jgi:hypothetical protein